MQIYYCSHLFFAMKNKSDNANYRIAGLKMKYCRIFCYCSLITSQWPPLSGPIRRILPFDIKDSNLRLTLLS